jgi:hypothetical protein
LKVVKLRENIIVPQLKDTYYKEAYPPYRVFTEIDSAELLVPTSSQQP